MHKRDEAHYEDDYEGVELFPDITHIEKQNMDNYAIHTFRPMNYVHNFSEYLLLPIRSTLFWFTSAFIQRKNLIQLDELTLVAERRNKWVALIKGLLMTALFYWAPFSLLSVIALGIMLRFLEHSFRHPANFLVNEKIPVKSLQMTEADPFNFLHWNAALGSDFINARNSMPDAKKRVHLIANYITCLKPDIVLLEEIWNEDAAEELVAKLKQDYKYLIFNLGFNTNYGLDWLATVITGLNSGLLLATNYEVEFRQFSRFKHMLPRDRPPARGALEVAIKLTDNDGMPVYAENNKQREIRLIGVHAQSDHANGSAEARHKQFKDIHATIEKEKLNNSHVEYIIAGDTNCPGDLQNPGSEIDESGRQLFAEMKNTLFFSKNYKEYLIPDENKPCLFKSKDYAIRKKGTFFNVGEHEPNLSDKGKKIEPSAFGTNKFDLKSPAAVIDGIFYDKTLVPKPKSCSNEKLVIEGETIIRGDIPVIGEGNKKTPVSDHLPVHSKLYYR